MAKCGIKEVDIEDDEIEMEVVKRGDENMREPRRNNPCRGLQVGQ